MENDALEKLGKNLPTKEKQKDRCEVTGPVLVTYPLITYLFRLISFARKRFIKQVCSCRVFSFSLHILKQRSFDWTLFGRDVSSKQFVSNMV